MSLSRLKRILIGTPFPTSAAPHERLDKLRALAVFASDPISSNAYATEAIMTVLIVLGSSALALTMPLALGIVALVILVVFSYTQTILHYPEGGGAYIVSQDNLGKYPGLLAGAALLVDYALTVSVSVAAGIRALASAMPELYEYRVPLALATILVLTLVNLRGVRESGTIFAFPTYAFVGGVLLVLGLGLVRYFGLLGAPPLPPHPVRVPAAVSLSGVALAWLLLRAYGAGCTALTGIEAISDGVAAFKEPSARNAAITMLVMGMMAMTLFAGISFLATHMNIVPEETESVLSQMTRAVTAEMPAGRYMYGWVQLFTMLILVLAANTGYQDFPRLSYFLARDGFLPRWMMNRGDRLVYSSGITVLAVIASLIILAFRGDEIAMLPLYAIGVMVSFTLSQSAMVKLFSRVKRIPAGGVEQTQYTTLRSESGVVWKQVLSLIGATVTCVVLLVLVSTKFREGAWIVVVAIALLILMFRAIRRHYDFVRSSLSTRELTGEDLRDVADVAIVPIADVHRGSLRALKYASRISRDVRAVAVCTSESQKEKIRERWSRFPELTSGIRLVLIDYDYRDIIAPLFQYIDYVNNVEFARQLVTVVVPEFVPGSLAENLLHNQTAHILRLRLRPQPDIVVIDVPYHLSERSFEDAERRGQRLARRPPSGVGH